MARFKNDWATAAMVQQYLKNGRRPKRLSKSQRDMNKENDTIDFNDAMDFEGDHAEGSGAQGQDGRYNVDDEDSELEPEDQSDDDEHESGSDVESGSLSEGGSEA